ncbi:YqaA family protein [Frigidibacter sp. ROC022]|uniref:YqaA family protein n=1 Tax=Frigidibacter sp. ROC022 TaxID=2971796 RepID=UPI00215A71C7|nr:YqaA family protein [Frigidibacter sp. ROC022]MCR8726386.1 DedA family protein [Frigidibacter sp. ROC022]
MHRRLYQWVIGLAEHPKALWALALIAFVESSVFPIPPDVLMIPMIIARPSRAFVIAGVALAASVLGGILGYAIGAFFFDQVGQPVLAFYGKTDSFDVFAARYNEWGAWAVLIAGVTPFPYKVITIVSGVTHLNFTVFMIASVIARGLRFFVVAALLWKFGAPIRDLIERRLGLMFTLFVVILAAGFYVVKYL